MKKSQKSIGEQTYAMLSNNTPWDMISLAILGEKGKSANLLPDYHRYRADNNLPHLKRVRHADGSYEVVAQTERAEISQVAEPKPAYGKKAQKPSDTISRLIETCSFLEECAKSNDPTVQIMMRNIGRIVG